MAGTLSLYQRWGIVKPPPGAPVQADHPLAQGLVGLWLCNEYGGLHLFSQCGRNDVLTLDPTVVWCVSPAGVSLRPTVVTTSGGILTAPSVALQPATAVTLVWYGVLTADSQINNPRLAGVDYDNANSSPFIAYGMYRPNTTDIVAGWNNGSFQSLTATSAAATYGQPVQYAFVLSPQAATLYRDGRQIATTGVGLPGTISYGATAPFVLDRSSINQLTTGGQPVAVYVYRRPLQQAELQWLRAEPYAMIALPTWRRYVISPITVQTAVPVSDVSAGGWTPSTGTDLYAMLDETVADDTNYIQSARAPANAEAKVRLGPLTDPNSSTGHIVRYRFYKDPDGGAQGDLTVTLYAADGTTVITSQVQTNVAPGVVAGTFTLSGAEADAIPSADYATGLVVGFKGNAP